MAGAEIASPDELESADLALRFVYPDLKFERSQITPEAAVFAFEVLRRVNVGARAGYGLFKLYPTTPITRWRDIPRQVIRGARASLQKPDMSFKSEIALAFIAWQHRRNLQQHLRDSTFPCPGFQD